MSRRSRYQFERSRSQRDGGIGIAMYRIQQRNKKPPISKQVAREIGKFFRKPRKSRRR